MIKQLRERFRRVLRRCAGHHDCPICTQQTLKWVKDWIVHPDEPPLFGHWQCFNPKCLVSSPMESTPWADQVANEYGYPTYKEAIESKLRERGM